jgi:hypothetical protein
VQRHRPGAAHALTPATARHVLPTTDAVAAQGDERADARNSSCSFGTVPAAPVQHAFAHARSSSAAPQHPSCQLPPPRAGGSSDMSTCTAAWHGAMSAPARSKTRCQMQEFSDVLHAKHALGGHLLLVAGGLRTQVVARRQRSAHRARSASVRLRVDPCAHSIHTHESAHASEHAAPVLPRPATRATREKRTMLCAMNSITVLVFAARHSGGVYTCVSRLEAYTRVSACAHSTLRMHCQGAPHALRARERTELCVRGSEAAAARAARRCSCAYTLRIFCACARVHPCQRMCVVHATPASRRRSTRAAGG